MGSNAKTKKGDSAEKLTSIMYLTPSDISGYDVCPYASKGCRQVCLYTSGRGAMGSVQKARLKKTLMFFEERERFIRTLRNDLDIFSEYCQDHNLQGYTRLNGTSDIDFTSIQVEDKTLFEHYPDIQFYDYTKDFDRVSTHDNYYLVYSRSEDTKLEQVKRLVSQKRNVAVVFDVVPEVWEGIPVIDGDEDDLRPEDPRGVIIGLKAKGLARKQDSNGFVIPVRNI